MTQIKEKTIEMINRLPEEKMIYVFNILQNIEAMATDEKKTDEENSKDAFETLLMYSGVLKKIKIISDFKESKIMVIEPSCFLEQYSE